MNSFQKFFGIIIVIFMVLSYINVPSQSDYVTWLKGEFNNKSGNNIFVALGLNLFEKQINERTVCTNYILLMYCKTNMGSGKSVSAVGYMKKFYYDDSMK
ncbi:hypothetical protein [Paenibacillus agricola]|uniref:Uncharacterized protein n=1 Tax=Paenibacillus agricola TaxID=2716264 RepID=A0ABX0JEX7_9BACL|nr:hypothetical protein [Paenibacillus agricola]NHN34712.1 hypothetical protein [Paenibacillus agricola]